MGGKPHLARDGGWWVYLVGSGIAAVAAVLLPGAGGASTAAAVGLSATAAIWHGVRRSRPRRRLPWAVLAVGLVVLIGGGLVAPRAAPTSGNDALPTGAGAALTAHLAIAAALVLLTRGRRRGVAWGLVGDAAIIAGSAGAAAWLLLVRPVAAELEVARLADLTAAALPPVDAFLLAIAARLALGRDTAPAARLLLGGVAAMLVADVAWIGPLLRGTDHPGYLTEGGWLVVAVIGGATALHPSMRRLGSTETDSAPSPTAGYLAAMASSAAATPAALALHQWWRGVPVDPPVVVGGAAAVSLLVSVRLYWLAGQHARVAADQQRRRGEQRFRAAVRHAAEIVVTLDRDGVITMANPAVEPILGYRADDLVGRRLIDLAEPSEGERLWWFFAELLAGPGHHAAGELCLRHRNGTPRALAVTATNLLASPDGGGIVVNARDIGDRVATPERPDEPDSWYRSLVERIPVITYVGALDPVNRRDWTLQHVSPQLETLLGYSVEEYLGDPKLWRHALHPEDAERILADEARAMRTGEPLRVEYRLLAADGRVVWVRDEAVLVRDAAGTPLCWHGVLSDISERKQFEDALRHQAFHDPLTGLPNRALFLDRLARALEASRRDGRALAVLFLDLNGFKLINDNLGHDAGDHALVLIARRLDACRRPGDTLARFGGDEFAILLEGLGNARGAVAVTERIAAALRDPLALMDQDVSTSASVGIAVSVGGQGDAGSMLREADAAMYEAKQTRAGYVIFDQRLSEHAQTRLQLEADLRRAVVAGDEMRLAYQPVVDLTTGQIVEVEALVRWEHPAQGTLLPPIFVPLAEELDVIDALGQWVLATACRQAAAWDALPLAGPPPIVTVNLSARQLACPTLIEDVAAALAANNLPADRLQLEMSESTVLAEEATPPMLRALSDLGVRLALDNFGTGYASLSALTRIPLDGVKLDRTFVAALGRQPRDADIVAAVMAFARALELSVTAQGIETAAQVAILRALGCARGQGFYFARPQTAEVLTTLLASHREHAAPTPIRLTS